MPKSARKRGFFEILANILKALIKEDMPRTHIVYSANLNFKRLPSYLSSLEKLGLLEKVDGPNGTKYRITEKGRVFLRRYQDTFSLLDEGERK